MPMRIVIIFQSRWILILGSLYMSLTSLKRRKNILFTFVHCAQSKLFLFSSSFFKEMGGFEAKLAIARLLATPALCAKEWAKKYKTNFIFFVFVASQTNSNFLVDLFFRFCLCICTTKKESVKEIASQFFNLHNKKMDETKSSCHVI
jgi:hypothetical protein